MQILRGLRLVLREAEVDLSRRCFNTASVDVEFRKDWHSNWCATAAGYDEVLIDVGERERSR